MGGVARVFVQQPYFLPWLGFFAKYCAADYYVALDDASFRRNDLSRVGICGPGGRHLWLKLPVGGSQTRAINEVPVPIRGDYLPRMLKTVQHSYGRAAHFAAEYPTVRSILTDSFAGPRGRSLADANLEVIQRITRHLGLTRQRSFKATDLCAKADRTRRLIRICESVGAGILICGDGNMRLVHDTELIAKAGIELLVIPFRRMHPIYPQIHATRAGHSFQPGLSVIDALLNIGASDTAALLSRPLDSYTEIA